MLIVYLGLEPMVPRGRTEILYIGPVQITQRFVCDGYGPGILLGFYALSFSLLPSHSMTELEFLCSSLL